MMLTADAATVWSAIGAFSTFLATVVALATALIFTRKQTTLTHRAAENAKLAAQAAVDANKLSEKGLKTATLQLEAAMRAIEVAAVQAEIARAALDAADRPQLQPGALRFDTAQRLYVIELINNGKGPGGLVNAQLELPDGVVLHGVASSPMIGVGARLEVTFSAGRGPDQPAEFVFTLTTVNAVGADPRITVFHFDASADQSWREGARLSRQTPFRPLPAEVTSG